MIPALGVSLLAVAGFGLTLWRCRVAAVTGHALDSSMTGLLSMLDGELDDRAKEIAVRRAGLDLIVVGYSILWRFGAALAAAAVPILAADGLGLAPRDAVLDLMVRPDYLVAVSVAAIALGALVRRWRPAATTTTSAEDRYSVADRFSHAVAFSSPRVLKAASRMEDRVLSRATRTPSAPPIFITSLARGGTTALLNALADLPGVATHRYRDMPFLTAPSLWNRLAGGHMRRVDRHERAHGDGLEIDLDSPEAFEEVVWRMFWPGKYRGSSISLWREDDRKQDAEQFLRRHMQKVIHARLPRDGDDEVEVARYCSKNNANIARLPYLRDVFAEGRVVVPIRRPECHAASLLRQHQNFLRLQAEDDFVRRYMRDIGHFEFGRIHKPFEFPGFDADRHDPATGDYWLDYWIHAFREVLEHGDHGILVSQDDLRAAPQDTMTSLCDALGLGPPPRPFGTYFRSEPDQARTDLFDQRLLDEATDLYRDLESRACLRDRVTT